jgi:hypothetical protein
MSEGLIGVVGVERYVLRGMCSRRLGVCLVGVEFLETTILN